MTETEKETELDISESAITGSLAGFNAWLITKTSPASAKRILSHVIRFTVIVNSFDEDADMEYIQQAYEQFVEVLVTGFYAFMFSGVSMDDLLDAEGFIFSSWGNIKSSASASAVPSFTQRTMSIRSTSTNLRSVTETEAEQALRDGRITIC